MLVVITIEKMLERLKKSNELLDLILKVSDNLKNNVCVYAYAYVCAYVHVYMCVYIMYVCDVLITTVGAE